MMTPTPIKVVDRNGKPLARYPSRRAAAQAVGLDPAEVGRAVADGAPRRGVWFRRSDIPDAEQAPLRDLARRPKVRVRIGDRDYASINQARKAEGVSYDTMWRRVNGRAPGSIRIGAGRLAELQRRAALGLPLAGAVQC